MVDQKITNDAQDTSKISQTNVNIKTVDYQEKKSLLQEGIELKELMNKKQQLDENYPDWKKGPRNFYNDTKNYDTKANLPTAHQLKKSGEFREYIRNNMMDNNNKFGDKFREIYIDDIAERAMLETHKKEKGEAFSNPLLQKQHQLEKDFFYSSKKTYDKDTEYQKVDFQKAIQSYQNYKREFIKTYRPVEKKEQPIKQEIREQAQVKALSKSEEIKKKLESMPIPEKNKSFSEKIDSQISSVITNIKNLRKGQSI